MTEYLNKQSYLNHICATISGFLDPGKNISKVGTNLAESGDLIFCIIHYPNKNLKDELKDKNWKNTIRFRSRAWLGFEENDFSDWHVAILFTARKRSNHKRINPWIIHSNQENGVQIKHVTPLYFINKDP